MKNMKNKKHNNNISTPNYNIYGYTKKHDENIAMRVGVVKITTVASTM